MDVNNNTQTLRCYVHDYCEPCIYMLTVTVEGRKPLLGRLEGDAQTAHVELSPLGVEVRHELYALCDRYPQLRLLQYQIMPDHVHVIIHVTERIPKPLGSLFSSWKIACGQAYGKLAGASAEAQNEATEPAKITGASARTQNEATEPAKINGASAEAQHEATGPQGGNVEITRASSGATALAPRYIRLFSKGYNDRILRSHEQLQHMIAYVRDNPRRLIIKRAQSPYFTLHRGINIAGYTLDAIGNLALLRAPMLAVHCRRHWTATEQQDYHDRCLSAAQAGTILIGAFISKTEQSIAHDAHEQHLPLIHIMEKGFNNLYKPVGKSFYATAEGRLLQLAPWPYHSDSHPVYREQCNAMNIIAETIAKHFTI